MSTPPQTPPVDVRAATPDDDVGVIRLLSSTLGWDDDTNHQALFDWKHRQSPFGLSLTLVALIEGSIVGFRAFMPWRFRLSGKAILAVRPVDTATDPRYQRQGVFTNLTRRAIDESVQAGTVFVFNTPNGASLPGYLKMGWKRLGRLDVRVTVHRPGALIRTVRARQPAGLWTIPTTAGVAAATVLSDDPAIEELLATQPATSGRVTTERSKEYLRWRYGSGPMGYRALTIGSSVRDGVAFWRLRRRGPSLEVAIGDILAPAADSRVRSNLVRNVLRMTKADHALVVGGATRIRDSSFTMPMLGPHIVGRSLTQAEIPPLGTWDLSLGDIELF